jgi:hypothetical protein
MKKRTVKYTLNVPKGHELADPGTATFIRGKSQWPIDKEGLLGYIEDAGSKKGAAKKGGGKKGGANKGAGGKRGGR